MFVEGFFLYNFACVCCGGRQVSARISHACFSRRLLVAQNFYEVFSQPYLCANLRRSLSAQFRLREFLSQPPLCANLRRLLSAQFRLREFLSHPPLCANLRRSLSALLFCTIFLCSRSSSPTALSLRKFTQPRPQPKITQTAPCAAPPQSTPPACTRRPPPTTSKSCAPPRHTRAAPAPACPLSSAASGT